MSQEDQLNKLRAMFGTVVADLDDVDSRKALGLATGDLVTKVVGYLSCSFPQEDVNRLMTQVWHLIGSATTPVAIGPVRTPSSVLSRQKGRNTMMILVPPNWVELAMTDFTMALGAMIFCGSQAVDFYNNRLLENPDECADRGRAYEAEALRIFQNTDPAWVPNSYQAAMLAKYPDGLKTEGVVLSDPLPTPSSTTVAEA